MSGSLIINARHRLAWHQRLFSDASTAMMWGGWLWLWSPVLRSSDWLAALGVRSYPTLMKLLASGSADDLQRSVVALVGTTGTLLVWTWLPARKARPSALSVRDYARHFELPEHELQAGRHASVCVVHHDDEGRIVQLECREPGQLARPAQPERREASRAAESIPSAAIAADAMVGEAMAAEAMAA
jgi:poly-beta-1,6-N-acetyl-D-glucosamine biosynthesis protein PgaD